ncbi:hypothetical protein Q9R32_01190 [Actinotalea sp. AC32]|nr:hypothetical protein [Actinotalea sp. AC32]
MGERRGVDAEGDLVATGGMARSFWVLQLVIWATQLLLWGPQALTEREPLQIVMAIFTTVGLAAAVWMGLTGARIELLVHEDSLELRRRFRPLTVARADVIGFKGNVSGRPSWSEYVIIETRSGEVRLPALKPSPSVLLPRLQRWAGVDEKPDP